MSDQTTADHVTVGRSEHTTARAEANTMPPHDLGPGAIGMTRTELSAAAAVFLEPPAVATAAVHECTRRLVYP